jgi:hypothetical protein
MIFSKISAHFARLLLSIVFLFTAHQLSIAQQQGYWQQEVDYEMEIDMDVETNRFDGFQKLTYTNHSPDTLNRVFYHLFFNAFQPNSMMDIRSRNIADPDRRIGNRIAGYDSTQIGYQDIQRLSQNGKQVDFTVMGTILEVHLNEPILPGEEAVFEMDFQAQVPLQTRRSGRDNREGVRYSMSQWYPKIAAYDRDGWHPNPYIAREFYAPFGTFDVVIHIDRDYVVAAGSILQNPNEVGFGYQEEASTLNRPDEEKLTWHFRSENVHDFMWAADPDFKQTTIKVPGGPLLRFFYQDEAIDENASAERNEELQGYWELLPWYTSLAFEYMSENYGSYPYKEYSVIQGGDGGMEYTMGTLITGNRSLRSLVGVTVHELVHAWYEGAIGNNEVYDQWIDEGFTVYASAFIMNDLFNDGEGDPMSSRYGSYRRIVEAGLEEPMHIHSDHYETNTAYGVASYTKGAIFLHQLSYIIGEQNVKQSLNKLLDEWKFKHPTGEDFIRIAEEVSGIVLDWYYEYWVTTTREIDYAVASVTEEGETSVIQLSRLGQMPMPVEAVVSFSDGTSEMHYIPMRIMWGEKVNENPEQTRLIRNDWPWVQPDYMLTIARPISEIEKVEIDPSGRMADINRVNNVWSAEEKDNN